MLILTRTAGQSIEIGNDIIFTMVSLTRTQMRLHVFGPPDTVVRDGGGAQVLMAPWGPEASMAELWANLQDDVQIGPANVVLAEVAKNRQARIGITAPKTVRIMRKEVIDRKPELAGKMPRSVTGEPKVDDADAQPQASPEELEKQELLQRYGFVERN